MPYITVERGIRLHVRDWGDGPPVVLLAGWAMDSRIWAETMQLLNAMGLRAIAYDRRGHGRSDDPQGNAGLDYDTLADDLLAVLETLDLRRSTLVTHSGAAGEAIRFLSRHGGERVSRLVMVGATGPCMIASADNRHGIPAEMAEAAIRQIAGDLASWLDDNASPFAPTAHRRTIEWLCGMVMDTPRRSLVEFQRTIAQADLRQECASITIPTTLVHGTRDVSAPIGMTAERYASLIEGAEMLVYDGAAHGVMFDNLYRLASDIAMRAR